MTIQYTRAIRKLYTCNECNQVYKNKISYTKHMIEQHDTYETFKCLHCDKTFKQNGNMHIHMIRHHNTKKPSTRIDRNNVRKTFCKNNEKFKMEEHTDIHKPKRFSIHFIDENNCDVTAFTDLFSKRNAMNIVDNLNIIYNLNKNKNKDEFLYHWVDVKDAILSLQNDRPNQQKIIEKSQNFIKQLVF